MIKIEHVKDRTDMISGKIECVEIGSRSNYNTCLLSLNHSKLVFCLRH